MTLLGILQPQAPQSGPKSTRCYMGASFPQDCCAEVISCLGFNVFWLGTSSILHTEHFIWNKEDKQDEQSQGVGSDRHLPGDTYCFSYLLSWLYISSSHAHQENLNYPFIFFRQISFLLSVSYDDIEGAQYPQRPGLSCISKQECSHYHKFWGVGYEFLSLWASVLSSNYRSLSLFLGCLSITYTFQWFDQNSVHLACRLRFTSLPLLSKLSSLPPMPLNQELFSLCYM